MKKKHYRLGILSVPVLFVGVFFVGCKKENSNSSTSEGITSLTGFYQKNATQSQSFSISAATGGSFTTSQATVVNIPANVFADSLGQMPAGDVTIMFKDVYKKSDMLLSNAPTMTVGGRPLKSGGEFFISVKSNNKTMLLANGNHPITIQQPLHGAASDAGMQAFTGAGANNGDVVNWTLQDSQAVNKVVGDANSYIYSLYQFNSPAASGTWCNSDNASFFSAYAQTNLNIHGNYDASFKGVDVFVVFKSINCVLHVYKGSGTDYPYAYAPVGLPATIVAVGCKNGNLYSSFTPITISANQTVNFDLEPTTSNAFKTALTALD
jgi:hypothetical protein